ncbi:MAG: hypothetical protein ACHBN1_03345 [Heteroscytonema crispum UTEX LB 1556]
MNDARAAIEYTLNKSVKISLYSLCVPCLGKLCSPLALAFGQRVADKPSEETPAQTFRCAHRRFDAFGNAKGERRKPPLKLLSAVSSKKLNITLADGLLYDL